MPAWLQAMCLFPTVCRSERMLLTLSTNDTGVLRALQCDRAYRTQVDLADVLYQVV